MGVVTYKGRAYIHFKWQCLIFKSNLCLLTLCFKLLQPYQTEVLYKTHFIDS